MTHSVSIPLPAEMLSTILSMVPTKQLAQELLLAMHDIDDPNTSDRLLIQCLHHYISNH
jgi:hypothetical protein